MVFLDYGEIEIKSIFSKNLFEFKKEKVIEHLYLREECHLFLL